MEQLSLFDLLQETMPEIKEEIYSNIRSVGEKIGRVVLGECRIATITSVEGNGKFTFYRTDRCCYNYADGLRDVEELVKEAEMARPNYKTIIPENLTERMTVEYTRSCDKYTLWAQVGILGNMLFWKEDCTYQFLEPYDDPKKLRKEYEKHKKALLDYSKYNGFRISSIEHPMERLYWSNKGFYATAEYVKQNG